MPHRITPAYLAEQKILHADPRGYGTKGRKWADEVESIIARLGKIDAVLDYGCGGNTLAAELASRGHRTRSYDPAIPAFAHDPLRSDLVTCTDVLEHVEEPCVAAVLEHLAALTRRQLFVVISLVETAKLLSDGRQAHITLKPAPWWVTGIEGFGFKLVATIPNRPEKQFVGLFERTKS